MYMTSAAKSWMEVAVAEYRATHPHWNPLIGPVWVLVVSFTKNRGNWDIDNRFKLLLDTLSAAGIWGDDRQVVNLHSHMLIQGNLPKPYTRVYIWELEPNESTAFAKSVRWAR
jgi:Holliday junction resolvase RusA-like endonuclease